MGEEYPKIKTTPPGPKAKALIARDEKVVSRSFKRWYPMVADKASGAIVVDIDGNR